MREKNPPHKNILVLDFGSTLLKAGLFSGGCAIPMLFSVDYSTEESDLLFPRQIAPKLHRYLVAWKKISCRIQEKTSSLFSALDSLIIATCSPALVALDRGGIPVAEALFPADLPRLVRPQGGYYHFLAQILLARLKKESPDRISSIDSFLSLGDYFAYLLCGKKVTSLPTLSLAPYLWKSDSPATLQAEFSTLPTFVPSPLVESGTFLASVKGSWASSLRLPSALKLHASSFDYALDLLGANGFDYHQLILRGGTYPFINKIAPLTLRKEEVLAKGWNWLPHPFASACNLSRLWVEPLSGQFDDLLLALDQLASMGLPTKTILYCGGGSCDPLLNQAIADATSLPLYLLPEKDAVLIGGFLLLKSKEGEGGALESVALQFRREGCCYRPQKR